jgi:hypothetical protein
MWTNCLFYTDYFLRKWSKLEIYKHLKSTTLSGLRTQNPRMKEVRSSEILVNLSQATRHFQAPEEVTV